MKLISKAMILVLTALFLQGCSNNMNKQSSGTLIGGVAGGLLGSRFGKGGGQIVTTGVGALAGALIGGQIGKSLDETDRQMLELSSQKALEVSPSGSSVPWNNPDSGNYGTVTPTRTYKNQGGSYCREYTQDIVVGGERKKAYGKACREADGHWRIVQ